MTRMLVIGLVWLSISAFTGVLIGFAIHRADLRDERALRARRPADEGGTVIVPPLTPPSAGRGRRPLLTSPPRPRQGRRLAHRHTPPPPSDERPTAPPG